MIDYFWTWITQSISAVLRWLNDSISNSTISPFIEFFIVVFLIACLVKFIVKPLVGLSTGTSDKAKERNDNG